MSVPGPTWRRRADVAWRRSIDAVVLLADDADEPVALPGTAATVWDLLEVPATVDELVAALVEVYAADPTTVTADVTALLDRLMEIGAVEPMA